MDEAEDDVLAYMGFPAEHWSKIHSTNGLERLNGEVKRRTEIVGIFPNDDALVRLVLDPLSGKVTGGVNWRSILGRAGI